MTDLRQEIFHLERDLTRERLKCRALEDEIQNPLNIHRWRKLEGSDPDVLELLKKVQLLQKRLLQQASEAIEKERQLKEAEKLYVNLNLTRQPGPDVQTELVKTQRAPTIRGNKMKCLVSELNMTEQQALEYKEDLEKVREELKELKKKYLVEKKAQQNSGGSYVWK